MHNWTYISQHLVEWSMQPYVTILGFWFYPILFSAIIAYVYLKLQSATAGVIMILILIAVFGNALMGVDLWVTFLHIITALVITALVIVFILKRR